MAFSANRNTWCWLLAACLFLLSAGSAASAKNPEKSGAGYRFERGGWTYVHLEGTPAEIGFQHGSLLAAEIADMVGVIRLESEHATKHDWQFFRNAGRTMLWPHIDPEYQAELAGIAKGVQSAGIQLDVWDIVALNGGIELPEYYVPWLEKNKHASQGAHVLPQGRCSAFIATGSYTKGGKIVIAHNNWSSYAEGERWTVIFDLQPAHGHRIFMDGAPGIITSQDDFGINDAGLMITETTITQFEGWNPEGKPEFVRSRKALQYGASIDEYVSMIKDGNNGGYANDWLIGDRKTGEIAYLELGLRNTPLWRSKDGYFVSSNFPRDPNLIRQEASDFDPLNAATSPNARRISAEKQMEAAKGRIDLELAEQFLSDHSDSYARKKDADERSLCGHVDRTKRGVPEWDWAPYYPGGAVSGKAADSDTAAKLSLIARAGHPCGEEFLAGPFLAAHPEFEYLRPILKDMKSRPWTNFAAGESR